MGIEQLKSKKEEQQAVYNALKEGDAETVAYLFWRREGFTTNFSCW